MPDSLSMVKEFHQKFGCVIREEPHLLDYANNALRLKLLTEELEELKDAVERRDVVGVLDALTDLQYVLDGSYLTWGLADYKQPALEEVHASNMSKLGVDGLPVVRDDGKILKGPLYFPPDLVTVLHWGKA